MSWRVNPALAPAALFASALLAATVSASGAWAADVHGAAAILTNRSCAPALATCTQLDSDGNPFLGPKLQPNQLFGGYGSEFMISTDLLHGASGLAGVTFGADYLPTLHLASQAGADTRTGASLIAFQSFTYTGSTAIDLAFSGVLHFLTSGDAAGPFPTNDYAGDGTLNVNLSLQRVTDVAAAYPPGSTAADIVNNSTIGFGDCSTGALAYAGYNSSGLAAGEYNTTVGLSTACGGGAIVINPGDSFVVVAALQALTNRGGLLDASHTFTVAFDTEHTVFSDTGAPVGAAFLAQSVSQGASVPEPAAWALLLTGFAGLGAALRHRRRAGFA